MVDVGIEISNKEYHSSDKLSASKIKLIIENAAQYRAVYIDKTIKNKYTQALLVGCLHHTKVLEPQHHDRDYIVIGETSLKNDLVGVIKALGGEVEYKDTVKGEVVIDTIPKLKEKLNELRENEARTIVTTKDDEIAQETAKKTMKSRFIVENTQGDEILNATIEEIIELETAYVERTFYGEINGVEIQVRPDLLINLGKTQPVWFCVDLKTAQDATLEMFSKQSARFYYDVQEWIYREILRQNGIEIVDFRFCVAGKDEHSGCAFYQMDSDDIEDAGKIVKRAIEKYKYCKKFNDWQEGKFNFDDMRFEPVTVSKLPAYRKFQLIDMGVL